MYERLLVSPHRVTDPNIADYFYVPVWGGCWLSRFSRPSARHHDLREMARDDPEVNVKRLTRSARPVCTQSALQCHSLTAAVPLCFVMLTQVNVPRALRASRFYRKAYEYIRHHYPYWNRTNGADHFWTFPHDEGACLAPIEIKRSILISHWGRLMLHPNNHTSTSTGQGWYVVHPFRTSSLPPSASPHHSLPSLAAGTFRLTCIQWWGQNDASLPAKTSFCQSTSREASFKCRLMSLASQSRRTSCSTSVATRISTSLSIRWGSASSCTRFWSTIQIAASVPTRGDPARIS